MNTVDSSYLMKDIIRYYLLIADFWTQIVAGFFLGGIELQEYRVEALGNGAKCAVLRIFCDFFEMLFLKNEIKC